MPITRRLAMFAPLVAVAGCSAPGSGLPAIEEVARALGRGPLRAFAETTLVQAWPAAAGGDEVGLGSHGPDSSEPGGRKGTVGCRPQRLRPSTLPS